VVQPATLNAMPAINNVRKFMPSITSESTGNTGFDAIWENAGNRHSPAFCKTEWGYPLRQRILLHVVLFVTGRAAVLTFWKIILRSRIAF
jgi:hypothetical protein